MVEPVSALAGHLAPRRIGTVEPCVMLSELPIGRLWQFSAWSGRLEEVGRSAANAVAADGVTQPGCISDGARGRVVRTEPQRWLAISEQPLDRPDLAPGDGTLLDLSHARTRICVAGPAARELLARHVSIDLRARAFGPGHAASTAIGSLAALLMTASDGDGIEILVMRSFALALWDELLVSAEQFGATVA